MLLVGKKQGGGLFAPTQFNEKVADFSQLLDAYRTSGRRSAGRPAGRPAGTSGAPSIAKGLTSDVTYYSTKKRALLDAMDKGMQVEGFDKTPEYAALVREYHKLETTIKPALDAKKKNYDKGITDMKSKEFYATPAVVGDKALVRVAGTNRYGLVSDDELIKNADRYEMLNISEAAMERERNPNFHGMEQGSLGEFVDNLLMSGFGDKQYTQAIASKARGLGYMEKEGYLIGTPDGGQINLDDISTDSETGTQLRIKSNRSAVETLVNNMKMGAPSGAMNYIGANALHQLHAKARGKMIDVSDLNTNDINNLINSNAMTYMVNSFKPLLKETFELKSKSETDGEKAKKTAAGKDVSVNSALLATVSMKPSEVEVSNLTGIKSSAGNQSIIWKVPIGRVNDGNSLLEGTAQNEGYHGAGKSVDDKDIPFEEQGKKLAYNKVLNRIAGSNLKNLSLADGTLVAPMVGSDYGLAGVTTTPTSSLHFMLAPIQKNSAGQEVVNFDIPYIKAVTKAITESEALAKKLGISQEELAGDADSEKVREWTLATDKIFKDALKAEGAPNAQGLRIGLVSAVEVMFNKKRRGTTNNYITTGEENDERILEGRVGDDVSGETVKATAFVPVDHHFWSAMHSKNLFGTSRALTYTGKGWRAALSGGETVTKNVTPESISGAVNTDFVNDLLD